MAAFVQQVREGRLAGPTSRRYRRSKWQRAFEESERDAEDQELFEAGRWFEQRLSNCRDAFYAAGELGLSGAEVVRAHVASVNRDWCIIDADVKPVFLAEDTYSMEETLAQRIRLPYWGIEVDPEAMVEGAVDSLRLLMLSAASPAIEPAPENTDELFQRILKRNLIGSGYFWLESLWWDCVWGRLRIEDQDTATVLLPADLRIELAYVAARFRERTILANLRDMGIRHWLELPRGLREFEAQRKRVVRVEGSGKKRRLVFESSDPDARRPPPGHAEVLAVTEEYMVTLLDRSLPELPQLTLRVLLDAWVLLDTFSEAVHMRMPSDTAVPNLGRLWQFAPTFSRGEVVDLFRKGLGISPATASSIVTLLTYTGREEEDIWCRPFVQDNGRYLLVVPVARSANLYRVMDDWLRDGGLDLGERGDLFERFVRADVNKSIKRSRMLSGEAQSWTDTLVLEAGDVTEEIDLLLRIGATLLVGEAKCSVYPAGGVEAANYFNTLRKGAGQAARKAEFVRGNLAAVREKTGWGIPDGAQVVPFVLTNQPCGAGQLFQGVPVVDIRIIRKYLAEGELEMGVVFTATGEKTVTTRCVFYENAAAAADNVESYLRAPPQLLPALRWTTFVDEALVQMNAEEKVAVVRRLSVKPTIRTSIDSARSKEEPPAAQGA